QPVAYQFSAKEYDQETGLYYFGQRYYDPRVSTWVSTDPAIEKEFLPDNGQADEGKIAGLGGVFNSTNLNTYAYVHHRPIIVTDPDGRYAQLIVFGGGALVGILSRAAIDQLNGQTSTWHDYLGSATTGGVTGLLLLRTNPVLAGIGGSAAGNVVGQVAKMADPGHQQSSFDWSSFGTDVGVATAFGVATQLPIIKDLFPKIAGITTGNNNSSALYKQISTKLQNETIKNFTPKTAVKMLPGMTLKEQMLPSGLVGAHFSTEKPKGGRNGNGGGASSKSSAPSWGLGVIPYADK
ncbi:MAG TPA: RHS repeat-associated core domain-containing protein, partial [Turneriella sp.]|nr:RHS repeat-associated core domain-containing protein [Turneriella sp.]